MTDAEFDMPKAPASFEARGGWVVNRLAADLTLLREQAAGIVGNLGYESAGFTKLQEVSPTAGRGGYGWGQWTGPRRRLFEAWCMRNHLPQAADKANYGFLLEELRTTQKSTVTQLRKTSTLEDAVFSVGQTYERPGGTTADFLPGYDGRLQWARRALAGAKGVAESAAAPTDAVRGAIVTMQAVLKAAGYYTGEIDGDPGPQTVKALADYRGERE